VDRATPGAVLREMTPEKIFETLMTSTMKEHQGISMYSSAELRVLV
jgi:hypothetical protein